MTHGRLFLSLFWMTLSFAQLFAQSQTTGLQQPVALAVHASTGDAFIVEQGADRLIRWNGGGPEALSDRLSAEPTLMKRVTGAVFRGNRITCAGTSSSTNRSLRLATFKVNLDKPISYEKGLSGDLDLEGASSITAITSTEFALYLGTTAEATSTLWRLPVGNATMGKARPIHKLRNKQIAALAISREGHVVSAVEDDEKSELRFYHAETGQELLSVPTDVTDVTSLAYSSSGLLYAAAAKAERRAVYRLDVFFDGRRQSVRGTEIANIENLVSVAPADDQLIALVGGEESGRALQINVEQN